MTVAYSGGTLTGAFGTNAARWDEYIASQRKIAKAAADAGATVILSNHSEYDGAYTKARLIAAPRQAGENHPFIVGAEGVQRYFTVMAECATVSKLRTGRSRQTVCFPGRQSCDATRIFMASISAAAAVAGTNVSGQPAGACRSGFRRWGDSFAPDMAEGRHHGHRSRRRRHRSKDGAFFIEPRAADQRAAATQVAFSNVARGLSLGPAGSTRRSRGFENAGVCRRFRWCSPRPRLARHTSDDWKSHGRTSSTKYGERTKGSPDCSWVTTNHEIEFVNRDGTGLTCRAGPSCGRPIRRP